MRNKIIAALILLSGLFLGYGMFRGQVSETGFFARHPFRLGLDLSGGSHLLYEADTSAVASDIGDAMDALRDVIERRVNAFGVAEPVVQVQTSTIGEETKHRLSVELPNVTDIAEAIDMIGATPFLEFRTQSAVPTKATVDENGVISANVSMEDSFVPTELTGKYLKSAQLQFMPQTGEPMVTLQFNEEGATLFEEITRENVGKVVAIYLDGQPISAPVVQEAISGGTAQISGVFTPIEAKQLVGRLNSGALPVPIKLVSTEIVGATLGIDAVSDGVTAAVVGFTFVALFLLLWYRLPGLVAILALGLYVVITLLLYRFIPVTLTAAGIAGFIISIGMAVDANILIFERFREERARGKSIPEALDAGFARAWLSIRDANVAGLIIAVVLFWFGTTLIKGFALTFGLGILISMLSAIGITRVFLRALPVPKTAVGRALFKSGFN